MEQQLGPKVTQLESRVATLEDESKILKGEVKTILTEIRTAILARDNPFESNGAAAPVPVVSLMRAEPVAKVELVMPAHEEPTHAPPAAPPAPPPVADRAAAAPVSAHEPLPLRPQFGSPPPAAAPVPPAEKPHWSLLTIAGLSAWGEEAMRRLGPLRMEILLDLCEAAGHLTRDAREALSRMVELEVEEPGRAPSSNETVVILRQLEALLHEDEAPERIQRAA